MKKIITTTIAAGLVASVATAGVSTTFDFASAYVFRGVTYNDGPVFQPGIEADGMGLPESAGAIAVGAWANYDIDDYGGTLESSEFSEVDWYVSYSLPTVVSNLDVFVGYAEYTYPNYEAAADKEANVGLGYEIAGVGLGYTLYFNVGNGAKDLYNEFTVGYGIDLTEDVALGLGASLGYVASDEDESGFSDGSLGADVSYPLSDIWSVGASLTYVAQLDDEVLSDDAYDVSVIGMFSLGASF